MTAIDTTTVGPDLPGVRFVKHLGSGGFAEVYLYEQLVTGQKVAVKVLTDDGLDDEIQQRFFAEAKTTAELADHPFIVTVYTADITPEGRPYLVMQYYPRANLAVRCRSKQFSVREVLQLGVQLSSAVETAHRAGILHRDIKPANVLTDGYDSPGLTDFGIAGRIGTGGSTADGMSLPWSPPEIVDWLDSDERADVYSLSATLWHLLAGASPFEVRGGPNGRTALADRIKTMPVPAVPREDVPDSLQRLLKQGMAKDPANRPASALALANALRSIQQDLRLPMTEIRLREDEPVEVPAEEGTSATIIRAPQVIDPDSDPRHRFAPPVVIAPPPPPPPPPAPVPAPSEPAVGVAALQGSLAPLAESVDEVDERTARPGAAASVDERTTRTGGASPRSAGSRQPTPTSAQSQPSARGPRERQVHPGAPAVEATVRKDEVASDIPAADAAAIAEKPRAPRVLLVAALAVGLVVAVVVGMALTGGGSKATPTTQSPLGVQNQDALGGQGVGVAPDVPVVTAARSGQQVVFTWAYDNKAPGDSFRVQPADGKGELATTTTKPTVTMPATGTPVCLQVRVVRAFGLASDLSTPVCG